MFSRNRERTALETAVDRALSELASHEVGSDTYNKALESVTKLHSMKAKESPNSVSKDTLVIAASNIIGILMIIKHEHVNVLSSKALGLLIRPRP